MNTSDPGRLKNARAAWALVTLALVACQRDPLDRTVSASSPTAFAVWRSGIDSESGPELRRQVNDALLEIRLKVAGDREIQRLAGAKPSADAGSVDDAVRAKVQGRPLREVLQLGYELRVARLASELAGLQDAMHRNAGLVTRPGDVESRQHLEGLRDRQAGRVEQYKAELAAAERELKPLMAVTGRRMTPADEPPLGASPVLK
jgi:hypothetical protein